MSLRVSALALLVALSLATPIGARQRGALTMPSAAQRARQRRSSLLRYRMLVREHNGLSNAARFERLASDPAHGGHITPNGAREAKIGLSLERLGRLVGPIVREPTGSSEFIDARGQRWDVKAFNSHFPVRKGGFHLPRALRKLAGQFASGENVILDTQNLSGKHQHALDVALKSRGWDRYVIWP